MVAIYRTRQRKWQLRMRLEGRCHDCGKPKLPNDLRCLPHYLRNQQRARLASGSKPWKPGGSGRPPKFSPFIYAERQNEHVTNGTEE